MLHQANNYIVPPLEFPVIFPDNRLQPIDSLTVLPHLLISIKHNIIY